MKPDSREQYGTDDAPADRLPELHTVGWDRFKAASPQSLAPHVHPHAYEICYLVDGAVDWWTEREPVTLRRGDITVTRPGEWHGGVHSVMHPCELFWCQVAPHGLPDALATGLSGGNRRVFAGSDAVAASFDALLAEHRTDYPLAQTAARAVLHTLIVTVIRAANQPQQTRPLSPPIRVALERLSADLAAPYAVEVAAHTVGLTVPRFVEQFCAEVGETPAQWRIRKRLQAAQTALHEPGATVTEVAHRFGFASSQYFATVFKRRFGLSPGEWKEGVNTAV